MKKIISYIDKTRNNIITEQQAMGFKLIEDQRHFDGNFLIFDDGKLPRDIEAEIDALETRISALEAK